MYKDQKITDKDLTKCPLSYVNRNLHELAICELADMEDSGKLDELKENLREIQMILRKLLVQMVQMFLIILIKTHTYHI